MAPPSPPASAADVRRLEQSTQRLAEGFARLAEQCELMRGALQRVAIGLETLRDRL